MWVNEQNRDSTVNFIFQIALVLSGLKCCFPPVRMAKKSVFESSLGILLCLFCEWVKKNGHSLLNGFFPPSTECGGETLQNPSLLWVQQTEAIRKPLEGSKKLWMENKILVQSKRAVVYKEQMGKCWVWSLKDKDLNLIQLSRGKWFGFPFLGGCLHLMNCQDVLYMFKIYRRGSK